MKQSFKSEALTTYLVSIENRNIGSAVTLASRLKLFDDYNNQKTDEVIHAIKTGTIDAYSHLNNFVSFLNKRQTLIGKTITQYVKAARWFLEFSDIELTDRKFRMKVILPKSTKIRPSPLSKSDIVTIINSMPDMRLKTYVLFLAASGCRAEEALSIRNGDIDFDKSVIKLHADFTKTKEDRFVYLTTEVKKQIETWLEYKYRTRTIKSRVKRKWLERVLSPKMDKNDFVFLPYNEDYRKITQLQKINRILDTAYHNAYIQFKDRMKNTYPNITFHSFRRYVYTAIDELGQNQFADFYLGHAHSEYWAKSDAEKLKTFHAIEPYLTYLDVNQMEARTQDLATQLNGMKERIKQLENDKVTLEQQAKEMFGWWAEIKKNPKLMYERAVELDKEIEEMKGK